MQLMAGLAEAFVTGSAFAACGRGAGAGTTECVGGLGATALIGVVAALGYGVLRYAEKDSGAVRWAGRVAGWVLLVVGLLGFLCGAVNHGRRGLGAARCVGEPEPSPSTGISLPPGHPPIQGRTGQEDHPAPRRENQR